MVVSAHAISLLFVSVLLAPTLAANTNMGGLKRPEPRRGQYAHASRTIQELRRNVANLTAIVDRMLSPTIPAGGFYMRDADRERMIQYLWSGDYGDCVHELLTENSDLAETIAERTANTSRPPADAAGRAAYQARRSTRHNFLAGLIARNRTKDFVPKHVLLLSIDADHKCTPERFWERLSAVRVLMSQNWTEDLVDQAGRLNPGCPYPVVDWISAASFDNFTTHFNYSARHNADTQGERIDMTNWATIYLPSAGLPPCDLSTLPGANQVARTFRHGFDKFSVVDLCMPNHPDLVANRDARWSHSVAGIRAGTLFRRPTGYTPNHAHSFHFQPPIPGVLQSSYADVELELEVMRTHAMHRHSLWFFVGGDGLAINRINHTIARKAHAYLLTTPTVIPVQGEHPHGTAHVNHMGWRPYWPLIGDILRAIGHRECKSDWDMSSFNDYDHAACILLEGITKYFIHLEANGGPALDNRSNFATACSANVDLEWLQHCVDDWLFLYWDLRQSVRENNSASIDLAWREAVSFMHTSESNKTQYAPMAILRVFWSRALVEPLARIYHRNRTLSLLGLPGHNSGWDMLIEKENWMIRNHVVRPSIERITQ